MGAEASQQASASDIRWTPLEVGLSMCNGCGLVCDGESQGSHACDFYKGWKALVALRGWPERVLLSQTRCDVAERLREYSSATCVIESYLVIFDQMKEASRTSRQVEKSHCTRIDFLGGSSGGVRGS